MENYQGRQWASIKAGLATLTEPPYQTPRLQRLRGDLEEAHKKIDALFLTQVRESRMLSEGAMRERLRDQLRDGHLKPICKDAHVRLDGLPGVDEFFHLPHKRTKNDDLLEAADRIFRHAEEHKAVFFKGRWAKDFIKEGRAAANALKAKLGDTDTVVSRRSSATHSLGPAIAKGRQIMASIDSAVNSELANNLPARRRWAEAYRVPQTRGRPKNNRRARRIYPPPDKEE
jgi:hypothetical protein